LSIPEHRTFRFQPIILYGGILLVNVLSRVVLSPLLPIIEKDFGISHAVAGRLFLFIALGYSPAMILSGFISAKIRYRYTILLSIFAAGGALLLICLAPSLIFVQIGLFLLGASCALYIPSGIASIYKLTHPTNWGKAIAIHETGPTIALIIAPFIAELAVRFMSWRAGFGLVAGLACAVGVFYAFRGRGGAAFGEPPKFSNLKNIGSQTSFWMVAIVFWIGAAIAIGGYSILPLYLSAERGMDQSRINTIIGLSRMSGIFMTFVGGYMADRMHIRTAIILVCTVAGILTILIGIVSGPMLIVVLFLLPPTATAFFPIGFAGIAKECPEKLQNVAISLVITVAYLLASGVVPSIMGAAGEQGMFFLGYIVLGGLMLLSLLPLMIFRRLLS
jgi:MFS transporter, NNP family, nitrate/nitrite transporter